jgi:hypothetical protein
MLRRGHRAARIFVRLLYSALHEREWEEDRNAMELRLQRRPLKVVKTVLTLVALACAVVVVCWVGLALMGF